MACEPVRRRLGLVVGVVVGLALLLAGCGGDDDGPDPEAFCEHLRDGRGIGSDASEIDPADFELLLDVAPEDMVPVVAKLANTARSLEEIPDDDLDQLFVQAFDPEADSARRELLSYADEDCGISIAGITDGRVASDVELHAEIDDFLDANFATESWLRNIDFEFRRRDGALSSILVDFETEPETDDDPLEVCSAVSVFLYERKAADGPVVVRFEGRAVAERDSPDDVCNLS